MYFERTPELSERLCEEFEHGCKLFPDDDLSSFSSVIEKMQNTKEIPEGLFLVTYDQLSNELLCKIEQGSIAASLYDKLADRETIRSMIQSWGYRITRQLVSIASFGRRTCVD